MGTKTWTQRAKNMSTYTTDSATTIFDAAGMCVVNGKSLEWRYASAQKDENEYIDRVSSEFLSGIVAMSHCANLDQIKRKVKKMGKLLILDIHNSESMAKMPSFCADAKGESSVEDALSRTMSVISPHNILSLFLEDQDNKKKPEDIVDRLRKIFKGYNPLSIHEVVVFRRCGQDNCSCGRLAELVDDMNNERPCDPVQALMAFFKCMNHFRLPCPGDSVSLCAAPVMAKIPHNEILIVPLRRILLLCVDILSSFGHLEDIPLLSSFSPREFDENNSKWRTALKRRIEALPRLSQGFLAMVHCYLHLSRYTPVTADHFNLFIGITCARLMYSTAETLYCHQANATRSADDGKFDAYSKAYVPIKLMSAPLVLAKSVMAWRDEEASLAPLVQLISSHWQNWLPSPEDLDKASSAIVSQLNHMASPSKLINHKVTSQARNVRNIECYKPYGFVVGDVVSPESAALTKPISNGNNIACNALHVLPTLELVSSLAPNSKESQATFESCVMPGSDSYSTGRALGFFTALVNQIVCSASIKSPPENLFDHLMKRMAQLLNSVMFTKNCVCLHTLLNVTHLPSTNILRNPVDPNSKFDFRRLAVFMPWQRPTVPGSNVSALGLSQLELSLSRDKSWTANLAFVYFFLERICFEYIKSLFTLITETDGGLEMGAQLFGAMTSADDNRKAKADQLAESAIQKTRVAWFGAVSSTQTRNILFSRELFSTLYTIVVDKDMDPLSIINCSNAIGNLVEGLDDMLVKVLCVAMNN